MGFIRFCRAHLLYVRQCTPTHCPKVHGLSKESTRLTLTKIHPHGQWRSLRSTCILSMVGQQAYSSPPASFVWPPIPKIKKMTPGTNATISVLLRVFSRPV